MELWGSEKTVWKQQRTIEFIGPSPAGNPDHWILISECLVWPNASALRYQNNEAEEHLPNPDVDRTNVTNQKAVVWWEKLLFSEFVNSWPFSSEHWALDIPTNIKNTFWKFVKHITSIIPKVTHTKKNDKCKRLRQWKVEFYLMFLIVGSDRLLYCLNKQTISKTAWLQQWGDQRNTLQHFQCKSTLRIKKFTSLRDKV